MNTATKRNLTLYYIHSAGRASLFFASIWIAYQELFLSFEQIAFFASIIQITIIIFELPTGVLADLISRKVSMALGVILMGLGYLAILANSYQMMFLYVFSYGLGISMLSGADSALLFDTLKEDGLEDDYPKYSSNAAFVFQITATIAILLGGYMYKYNIHLPYLARGFTIMLSAIPALFMTEPKIDTYTFSIKSYIKQTKEGIREAFKNAYLAKLSLLSILIGSIAFMNHRFLAQKLMLEIGMGIEYRAWATAVIKFTVAFLTVFLARKKKLINSHTFLLFLPILMIISLIPLRYISNPLTLLFLLGVAIPAGTKSIFIGHFLNKEFTSKYRSTALSTINMINSLFYSVLVFIAGKYIALNSVGQYYQIIGIIILIVVLPLTINIIQTHKKRISKDMI